MLFSWQGSERELYDILRQQKQLILLLGLSGDYAISGFYANEILLRLLPRTTTLILPFLLPMKRY